MKKTKLSKRERYLGHAQHKINRATKAAYRMRGFPKIDL